MVLARFLRIIRGEAPPKNSFGYYYVMARVIGAFAGLMGGLTAIVIMVFVR